MVTDFGELRSSGRRADQRLIVQLPVAGMEHVAIGRIDLQRVALGDRMRQRQIAQPERPQPEPVEVVDHAQIDLAGDTGFLKLGLDQPGGERRGVKRNSQVGREIGHGADMILVRMGQHHADKVLFALLDEIEVGKDQIDARIFVAAESHTQVDHQPLAVAPIEVDVHADLARSAQRAENEFLSWQFG